MLLQFENVPPAFLRVHRPQIDHVINHQPYMRAGDMFYVSVQEDSRDPLVPIDDMALMTVTVVTFCVFSRYMINKLGNREHILVVRPQTASLDAIDAWMKKYGERPPRRPPLQLITITSGDD